MAMHMHAYTKPCLFSLVILRSNIITITWELTSWVEKRRAVWSVCSQLLCLNRCTTTMWEKLVSTRRITCPLVSVFYRSWHWGRQPVLPRQKAGYESIKNDPLPTKNKIITSGSTESQNYFHWNTEHDFIVQAQNLWRGSGNFVWKKKMLSASSPLSIKNPCFPMFWTNVFNPSCLRFCTNALWQP